MNRRPAALLIVSLLVSSAINMAIPGNVCAQHTDTYKPGTTSDQLNAMAADLYRQLRKTPGNLVFSPVSVYSALAMTYAGASGGTADELRALLHIDKKTADSGERLGEYLAGLRDAKSMSKFAMANSFWFDKTLTLEKNFTGVLKTGYGAEPFQVDFIKEPDKARLAVNGWVENRTAGRITGVLNPEDVTCETRVVLANAAAFSGAWVHEFDPLGTGTFRVSKDKSVKAPFMINNYNDLYLLYRGDGGVVSVGMPYDTSVPGGRPDKMPKKFMIIVMPRKLGGLASFENGLTAAKMKMILDWKKYRYGRVSLTMPKFEFGNRFDLGNELKSLGLKTAFGPAGDYSRMTKSEKIGLGKVIHKTFINVNEKGTEAAAATMVVEAATGAYQEPVDVVIDGPFLFFIVDFLSQKADGASILFMGRVADPTLK